MSVHAQSVRSALGDELRNLRWAFDSNDRRRAELLALADKVDDAMNPECSQTGCFLRHGHEETYRLRDELDGFRAALCPTDETVERYSDVRLGALPRSKLVALLNAITEYAKRNEETKR